MITDSAGNPIGGRSNQMTNSFTSNEKIDEIISLLSDITDKLDRNYEELHRYTNVTRQATSVTLNQNEEKKTIYVSLSSLEKNTVVSSNCIFAGYKRSLLIDFMTNTAQNNNCSFVYARGITSSREFIDALCNCQDNGVILFDFSEIGHMPETIPLLFDAIEDNILYVRLGKGSSSNVIKLDLPKIHIHLFAATESLISQELECCFDLIYVNE